ncbi:MAG: glutamine--tRNA ligase/YqeY domain fusion protein [Candidatus Binatia bacterium]|nr:glutamine--tRNA ligase/YqeY domain fusion protein [Candidatus Binatia bacterium]
MAASPKDDAPTEAPVNFVRAIVSDDVRAGKHGGKVVTRFPPEPNGYLHIGHAKAICINYGIATEHGGTFHLRFDDTNPEKEETRYVESIIRDVQWLGADWGDNLFYASDYFGRLRDWAVELIRAGKAYVDSLSADEIREYRGNFKEPGKNSPHRDRSVEENLDLFARMEAGEFEEGAHVLRAKIDMTSPNLNMRDPALYRIRKIVHHRAGDRWSIYPMYDFTHPLSDAIEGITHSLCSLEFEDHRPLYDWFLENLDVPSHPQQIEFARLKLTYMIDSKRKLRELVEEGRVEGWDDPRMPTLAGLRRRGYTPEAIRDFCERLGVAKKNSLVDIAMLEHSLREDLNRRAPRALGVLHPLKVVLVNYPEGQEEELEAVNNPEDESMGKRKLPFSRELYIERDDFREEAPKKYFRLAPGREVRLRWGYLITCVDVVKDDAGEVVELHCTYDPETRGGNAPDGRKVKGTIHWVSAKHAVQATVRLYDRLFSKESPDGPEWKSNLNPDSLEVLADCQVEPALGTAEPGSLWQFERLGYFAVDEVDSSADRPVFNRAVSLRDSWARLEKAGKAG